MKPFFRCAAMLSLLALGSSAPKATPAKSAKSSLSEGQRRQIFKAIVDAEDRAQHDADAVYDPDSEPSKNSIEFDRLSAKYVAKVRRAYNLTVKAQQKISDEGVEKQWPPLS